MHVIIGAHPSYDDKLGFGRRHIDHSLTAIANLLAYQVGALESLCQLQASTLHYVKPHGALYHDMMMDEQIFIVIVKTNKSTKPLSPATIVIKWYFHGKIIIAIKLLLMTHNVTLILEAFLPIVPIYLQVCLCLEIDQMQC